MKRQFIAIIILFAVIQQTIGQNVGYRGRKHIVSAGLSYPLGTVVEVNGQSTVSNLLYKVGVERTISRKVSFMLEYNFSSKHSEMTFGLINNLQLLTYLEDRYRIRYDALGAAFRFHFGKEKIAPIGFFGTIGARYWTTTVTRRENLYTGYFSNDYTFISSEEYELFKKTKQPYLGIIMGAGARFLVADHFTVEFGYYINPNVSLNNEVEIDIIGSISDFLLLGQLSIIEARIGFLF